MNSLLAAAGGGCLSVLWVFGHYTGRAMVDGTALVWLLGAFWLFSFGFIGAIISKLNLRLRDPSMSLAQMYFAQTWSFVSLLIVPDLTLYIYPLILITLVFGIFRVDAKGFSQFSQVGLTGVIIASC